MATTSEYMIEWTQPDGYDPSGVLRQLPSPISRGRQEIYNYSVRPDGFCLIDRGIDPAVTGHAIKLFIDEALEHSKRIAVRRL